MILKKSSKDAYGRGGKNLTDTFVLHGIRKLWLFNILAPQETEKKAKQMINKDYLTDIVM